MVNSLTGELKIHTNSKILDLYDNNDFVLHRKPINQFTDKLNNIYIVLSISFSFIFIDYETNQMVLFIKK
jgi:hypothetical protein